MSVIKQITFFWEPGPENTDAVLNCVLHAPGMDAVRNSFYALGQGFKVYVEVVLNVGEDVISVAGTDRGSDTAIVAKACKTSDIFSKDKAERLEIREILAIPLKKM